MAADQSDTSSPKSSQNPTAESGGSEANGDKKQTAPQRLGFFKGLAEIFKSLLSPDRPSRSMALLFVISLCGFSAVTFLLIQTLRQSQSLQKNAKAATDPHHSAEDHHSAHESSSSTPQYKKNLIELGSFQIELKPAPGAPPTTQVSDIATVDVVLLCESPETAALIKHSLPKVRNLIINALISVDREDLMTLLGKKNLKNSLIKKLNAWLTKGQVEDVFFSKLLLN